MHCLEVDASSTDGADVLSNTNPSRIGAQHLPSICAQPLRERLGDYLSSTPSSQVCLSSSQIPTCLTSQGKCHFAPPAIKPPNAIVQRAGLPALEVKAPRTAFQSPQTPLLSATTPARSHATQLSITILHRSPVRVFYISKREADTDGYKDYKQTNRHGQVHAFAGLRGRPSFLAATTIELHVV